jgi:hypothetical protein
MTDEIPAHEIASRNFVVSELSMVPLPCDKWIYNLNPQNRLLILKTPPNSRVVGLMALTLTKPHANALGSYSPPIRFLHLHYPIG